MVFFIKNIRAVPIIAAAIIIVIIFIFSKWTKCLLIKCSEPVTSIVTTIVRRE
ncbi:MAG: hypothetical protein HY808_12855 [Nitrospirae bacterium]|nr:hypothetical protein [Nitrospirota bacterium]